MDIQKVIRSVVMGILSGNPQDEPLHYGEVFGMWTNLMTNNGFIAAYQTFYNHAGDDDLKKDYPGSHSGNEN